MLRGGLLTFALSNGGSRFIFDMFTYDVSGQALICIGLHFLQAAFFVWLCMYGGMHNPVCGG